MNEWFFKNAFHSQMPTEDKHISLFDELADVMGLDFGLQLVAAVEGGLPLEEGQP
jgi:hypothetical protein